MTEKNNIKVLFIQPKESFGRNDIIPVSFLYMATKLQEASIDVEIIDARADDLNVFQVLDILKEKQFDVIGITGLNCAYRYIKDFCIEFKRIFPNTPLIAGGYFILNQPEIVLRKTPIDVACTGEGDDIIVDLVQSLVYKKPLNNINNLAFIDENGIFIETPKKRVENLEHLPAYDILNMKRYTISQSRRSMTNFTVSTGRGCSNHCYFCSNPYQKVIKPSAEAIVKHFNLLNDKYGIKDFLFSEENAFYSAEWVIDICNKLNEQDKVYNLHLAGCANDVTEEIAEALASLKGEATAMVAVEHWNPEIQNKFFRKHLSAKIEHAWKIFNKYDISIMGFNILWGQADDTLESLKAVCRKSFEMCKKYSIKSFSLAALVIYPNSQLLRTAISQGKLKNYEDYMYSIYGNGPYVNVTGYDDDMYRSFVAESRDKNFLKQILKTMFTGSFNKKFKNFLNLSKIIKRILTYKILLLCPKNTRDNVRELFEDAIMTSIHNPEINYYQKISCFNEILNLPQKSGVVVYHTKSRLILSRVMNSIKEADIELLGFISENSENIETYGKSLLSVEDLTILKPEYVIILSENYNDKIKEKILSKSTSTKIIIVDSSYIYKESPSELNTSYNF